MTGEIQKLGISARISTLKERTFSSPRYLSVEQARIITRVYRDHEGLPVARKRALALARSLEEISIGIDPLELIVGNRTKGIRAGVVFPEAGISWVARELDSLPTRPQDPFRVRGEDRRIFLDEIEPCWRGRAMEDHIYRVFGEELKAIEKVVKINQKDHAQGHICPRVENWLKYGPAGLLGIVRKKMATGSRDGRPDPQREFYEGVAISLEAAGNFIRRYAELARSMTAEQDDPHTRENLLEIARICDHLSEKPAESFRQALQAVWFLFVILQMESNASSFSPGRMDQYLYPYLKKDLDEGRISLAEAQELVDALFIKFNQVVYMRNAHSAKYFAGFPIGFNVAVGGQTREGKDAVNLLSFLILKAQDHIGLPQPNLTARLHPHSPDAFVLECSRVIGLGSGMPQIMNDASIIPALEAAGIDPGDATDYAVVGCVELSTQGRSLGWSDAAMFNLVKVLELTLNGGECLITGTQMGPAGRTLNDYTTFEELEKAYADRIDHFMERMVRACEVVEKAHQDHLPSPLLSSVVEDCLDSGTDVTSGGARYNFSGIQAIQVANVADSLAVIKKLVYEDEAINREEILSAIRSNYRGYDHLRMRCVDEVPKYGNDVPWVDSLGSKWVTYFGRKLKEYTNFRGGPYLMGLYTVSAHVPMGQHVGATPDGRLSGAPLADGGISPMYGQDRHGPTAVLGSVSRVPSLRAGNGTLLNMKFLPSFFQSARDREKFAAFLKGFTRMPIHHVQFNVVRKEDLLEAKKHPERYLGLTVRVAGYTAYFIELAEELQDEIIQRTCHTGLS